LTGSRRAIVEVLWAKTPARKAVIEPGGKLRVGRGERADLCVPGDRSMSSLHCEIRWDGETCSVTNRSGAGGTLLNGEQVEEGEIRSGSFLRVGDTVLMVYLERATPPRPASGLEGDGTDPLDPQQAAALAALAAQPAPLFAVLDAARTMRVIEVLRESVEDYRSLYEGVQGEALAFWAPYLVALPKGSRLLDQLVLEGWGRRWGIYLTCERPFDEVRTQLRRILMVSNDRSRKPMYFRFYDPKMLRLVLPTCGARQREQIFGEIEAFLVEGKGGEVVRFTARGAPAASTAPRGVGLDA
jgi:pSer/pThr/pTyr-binding forkhead associated (FHA) protein